MLWARVQCLVFLTHGVYVNVTMTVLGQTVSAIFSLAKDSVINDN